MGWGRRTVGGSRAARPRGTATGGTELRGRRRRPPQGAGCLAIGPSLLLRLQSRTLSWQPCWKGWTWWQPRAARACAWWVAAS